MIPTNIDALVWIQTAFLGDIVLTTGALSLARSHLPDAKQVVVTTPIGARVLSGLPSIDHIIVFDKRTQTAARSFAHVKNQLKSFGIKSHRSWTVRPHRSIRSGLLARYLAYPEITYRQSSLSSFATYRVDRIPTFHESIRISLLLEPLGIPREVLLKARPALEPLPLDPTVGWQSEVSSFNGPIIGIAPGSNWGTKRWPPESFKRLVAEWIQPMGCAIAFLGTEAEKALIDQIIPKVPTGPGPIWNLAGRTSFDDLRRIYPRLSLLICNDSSPIHFASAFNVPTLAIFGATSPAQGFGPIAPRSLIAEIQGLACRPCSDHGPEICPLGHFRCMNELGPDSVGALARTILGQIQ